MKHLMPLLILCLLLMGYTGCEKPTEPKDTPEPDTTSHNFVWDVDTIGYRSSFINGGVIINEKDIWAVGEIYPDSVSFFNKIVHGVTHWDGKKWTSITLPVKTLAGYTINYIPTSIVQISEKKFLLGMVQEFDCSQITKSWWIHSFYGNPNPVFEEGQNPTQLFKTPDGMIYCYGYKGALGFYNGDHWIKIPTFTDLDIVDMHGDYNPETKEYELLALASTTMSHMDGTKLFKVNPTGVIELNVASLDNYSKRSIWFSGGGPYMIAGDGVFCKEKLSDSTWKRKTDFPANNWYTAEIGGWSKNDFFLLQIDGHILHYNGSTWKDFKLNLNLNQIDISRIIVKDDMVLMTGNEVNSMPRSIIIKGKHIK